MESIIQRYLDDYQEMLTASQHITANSGVLESNDFERGKQVVLKKIVKDLESMKVDAWVGDNR